MFKIFKFQKVTSTNTLAKKLAEAGQSNFIIWAREQSAGRGQPGKNWYSPSGGLYFSLVTRPKIEIKKLKNFPYQMGRLLQKIIKKLYGLEVEIKKPNDLLLDGKKVAGILIESKIRKQKIKYLVIGIGVNLKNKFKGTPLEKTAVSLAEVSGRKISAKKFLEEFIKEFQL